MSRPRRNGNSDRRNGNREMCQNDTLTEKMRKMVNVIVIIEEN